MANGDTKTESYLRVAAEGTRADLPTDTCCNTKTQNLILGVANRIMDVEDEVEEIKNNPDVADIVATYADLQAYDKSKLTDKDVIRVLADETHDNDSTYYRYDKGTNAFTYIGESKQYTNFVGTDGQTAGTSGLVPAPATTDVDKFLKSDGTWAEAGGGGSTVNVVQAPGTSQTDVMSQNAATSMVYSDGSSKQRVAIGNAASAGKIYAVAIGVSASAYGNNSSVAIGRNATAGGPEAIAIGQGAQVTCSYSVGINGKVNTPGISGGVALGYGANATRTGEVNIGSTTSTSYGYNNTNYRVIGGVHDGQDAHDVATVGQINATIDAINTALSTNIPHIGA